jgi:hypothetical protein
LLDPAGLAGLVGLPGPAAGLVAPGLPSVAGGLAVLEPGGLVILPPGGRDMLVPGRGMLGREVLGPGEPGPEPGLGPAPCEDCVPGED